MPRPGTPTPRRSSPPCRCPIRKRNARGSCSRATCRRPRTRRPAARFTPRDWLGAAEAPTKMVVLGLSPVVISLAMVVGVFLARWSLPALLRGTTAIGADVRQAPHLVVWAILAGCLWAVANTLTIYAI